MRNEGQSPVVRRSVFVGLDLASARVALVGLCEEFVSFAFAFRIRFRLRLFGECVAPIVPAFVLLGFDFGSM